MMLKQMRHHSPHLRWTFTLFPVLWLLTFLLVVLPHWIRAVHDFPCFFLWMGQFAFDVLSHPTQINSWLELTELLWPWLSSSTGSTGLPCEACSPWRSSSLPPLLIQKLRLKLNSIVCRTGSATEQWTRDQIRIRIFRCLDPRAWSQNGYGSVCVCVRMYVYAAVCVCVCACMYAVCKQLAHVCADAYVCVA